MKYKYTNSREHYENYTDVLKIPLRDLVNLKKCYDVNDYLQKVVPIEPKRKQMLLKF